MDEGSTQESRIVCHFHHWTTLSRVSVRKEFTTDGNRVFLLDGTNSLPSFAHGAQTKNESGQIEVNTEVSCLRTLNSLSLQQKRCGMS